MTIAIVFPGQGSQSSGMQAALADACAEVRQTYSEASEKLGYDLWDLVCNGPEDKLNETVVTQPAMLAAGIAAWRCWVSAGGAQPAQLAGHSLGEYSALVAAGAVDFGDAVSLVKRRAELMQQAVAAGEGAMAAILGLGDEEVLRVCEQASETGIAEAVNFNSPAQIVVAGHRTAMERVIVLAKEAGARRAIMLQVSIPAHSCLMQPAGNALAESLSATEFRTPVIQVINSVDASPYADAEDIRQRLRVQVFSPVRWVDTVQRLIADGASSLIECGPGKVLTGLAKRIDRSVAGVCIDTPDSMAKAIALTA